MKETEGIKDDIFEDEKLPAVTDADVHKEQGSPAIANKRRDACESVPRSVYEQRRFCL